MHYEADGKERANRIFELHEAVHDRDSFIAFVEALAKEREDGHKLEQTGAEQYKWIGAYEWQNVEIHSFLNGCLDYFENKPFHKPESEPSWKMFADFLWFGKIIEL